MDWTDLQVFVEVAKLGSMAEAGRTLGLSQPTVRRRLDGLEVACGFTLLAKDGHGVKLTAVGRRLLDHAAGASGAADAAARRIRASGNRVTVAAIELVTDRILATAADEILEACPGVAITLESHRTRASLTSSTADIVILASPLAPDAEAIRLGDMEIGLYAQRGYVNAAGTLDTATDLSTHRVIGAQTHATTPFILGRLGLTDRDFTFTFLSDSTLAQIRALTCGGGVTAYYSDFANSDPDLVRVLSDTVAVFELWMWWPDGGDRPAVRSVSEVVLRIMRRHVPAAPEA